MVSKIFPSNQNFLQLSILLAGGGGGGELLFLQGLNNPFREVFYLISDSSWHMRGLSFPPCPWGLSPMALLLVPPGK